MTAPSREDAVRAVAEALSDLCADELGDYPCPGHYRQATAALDALTPYIAAVVAAAEPIIRAAIAAEIRAEVAAAGGIDSDVAHGLAYAARIAEGAP